ncbi:MAG: S-adenosylmethionine:tRNA ribosyltransferase-isomerase [Methanobacteriota archaeon]|nr:MAG: S-adenosylmethionine:tRNA ribosyltransferase-isomerase [Euryarchaeota archaeon]
MKRAELVFERPERVFAHEPPEVRGHARDDVRLLVTRPEGHHHARFGDLSRFLGEADLLVVNESAAIPASLPAEGRLGSILLNLCTRFRSDLWIAEPRWEAGKPGPLPIEPDEELRIGSATARLLAPYPGIPRLWFALADRPFESMIAERGGPIHYGYTNAWPMDTYQTLFSRVPGSAEMPSAARPITPRIREQLERAGVLIAPVLLHTGVSSLEIDSETVEAQAMYPEPFSVSPETADAVNRAHANGGRVIAVGTTVVRALESAWTPEGLRARGGFTRLFVNPDRGIHAVDGLLTGFHDPVTSHLALLTAFLGIEGVREAYAEAIRAGYLWHEFGDSHLVLPQG